MSMRGKVVAVTGGLGCLGAAVCGAFVTQGARVAAIDLAMAGDAEGDELHCFGGVDLADPAAAEAVFAEIHRRLGGPDVLVNVAGGFRWETLEDGALQTWERLFRINVLTTAGACKAALAYLPRHGAIVNVAAAAAVRAAAGMGAYAASKSGVLRLTESLAEELKDRPVRVNAVLPSIIDTPQNRSDMPDADFTRWVSPADLAQAIVFLAGNRATTGSALLVAGQV